MTQYDREMILNSIDEATDKLIAAVERLGDAELRAPSLLPGWSRGHVLAHIARNADALANLLVWARTGVETPAYADPGAREADILASAGASTEEFAADLRQSAARFAAEAAAMDEDAWKAEVQVLDGPLFPADLIPLRRLVEVELHHTDLGIGYRSDDWSADLATMELPDPMRAWRDERMSW